MKAFRFAFLGFTTLLAYSQFSQAALGKTKEVSPEFTAIQLSSLEFNQTASTSDSSTFEQSELAPNAATPSNLLASETITASESVPSEPSASDAPASDVPASDVPTLEPLVSDPDPSSSTASDISTLEADAPLEADAISVETDTTPATAPLAITEITLPQTTAADLSGVSTSGTVADLFNTEPQTFSDLSQSPTEIAQLPNPLGISAGWYISAAPSLVFGYDVDADAVTLPTVLPILPPGVVPEGDIEVDTDTGFGISGAVGYRFSAARAEFEVSYNNNDIEDVTINSGLIPGGTLSADSDGSVDNFTFMLNGYFDIPTDGALKPYIGGGAGLAVLSVNDLDLAIPGVVGVTVDDTATSFIFQAKAGLAYEFTPFTRAFLGYRLYGIPGQDIDFDDINFDIDTVLIHSVQAGVLLTF